MHGTGSSRRFRGRAISDTNRKQAEAPEGFALIAESERDGPRFLTADRGGARRRPARPPDGAAAHVRGRRGASPCAGFSLDAAEPGTILRGTALMVPESTLEQGLRDCRAQGVSWGTRVDEDRIAFSLRGGSEEERQGVFAALEARLGPVRIRRGEKRPAEILADALSSAAMTLVTAESCTGGLLGKYMTDIPGSSRVFWGGWVAYSYEAKASLLGVDEGLLEAHGAVSREVVAAMARGALDGRGPGSASPCRASRARMARPPRSPWGRSGSACCVRGGEPKALLFQFSGNRDAVRRRTAAVAGMLFAESVLIGREFLDTATKW